MTIQDLIKEGEDLKTCINGHILANYNDFNIWVEKVLRFLNKTYPEDMSIDRFEKRIRPFNPSYCDQIEFDEILSVLRGIEAIPERTVNTVRPSENKENAINISNNLSQNQNQHQDQGQDVISTILIEAIKDELTGKQRKELIAIAENAIEPEEVHKNIFDKLKEYGIDVSASILANILTNPHVFQNVGMLL